MNRPYAEVIGDPIAHSKSPLIHNFWLAKLGIDAEYRACHVRPDELADYLKTRNADDNWRGCNVTMPHKQAVIFQLDSLSSAAKRIGAVNTIRMRDYLLDGDNTDAPGFLEPLAAYLGTQKYRFASLIGTGGAARAIADALYSADFTIISYSRDPAKADREIGRYISDKDLILPLSQLVQPVADRPIPANPDRIDLLVNASALGMAGHPEVKVEFSGVEDEIVYDIVTHPLDTKLLQDARARGLRTIDGLAMLIGQAAAAFELFFGHPAPREHDAELRALLTS
jgi:shikimate dehydrogenase